MLSRSLLFSLRDEAGSQIVELGLVLIPLIGVVFLILDIAWVCFAQESLQHAVQVGVRAAITGSAAPDSIKTVVQTNAMGFLAGPAGLNCITVKCLDAANVTSSATCSGGNIVEVAVQNVPVSLLGPVIGSNLTSVTLGANSSDIMESAPKTP
jgi:Flp pilus assembly protein TadG